jgi:hypothetical protein
LELVFRPPEPLLIKNILLKLTINVERCLFSLNQAWICKLPVVFGQAQLA